MLVRHLMAVASQRQAHPPSCSCRVHWSHIHQDFYFMIRGLEQTLVSKPSSVAQHVKKGHKHTTNAKFFGLPGGERCVLTLFFNGKSPTRKRGNRQKACSKLQTNGMTNASMTLVYTLARSILIMDALNTISITLHMLATT